MSKLGSVEFSVGKFGELTPVAQFDPPIELAGTTVSRASMHNASWVEKFDVRYVNGAFAVADSVTTFDRSAENERAERVFLSRLKTYTAQNRNTGEVESGDAVTPNGLWKTNRERPNGWWSGDLGDIYRPKYFKGGIAIHGMTRVPNTPVSHGCVRLSTMAMDFIWGDDLVPLGTPVWVHE